MASRIIHLAVTMKIKNEIQIEDENRLKLGTILPDAYNNPTTTENSHFKKNVCEETKKTYNLTKFRELFRENIKSDDLYLGYYLHLIQDLVYRQFVYDEYHWNPTIPGNVEKLHNDYSLINTYVITQYHLPDDIYIPKDFEKEAINEMFHFDLPRFMDELKTDFVSCAKGESFFFTSDMADEYIEKAADICIREAEAIQNGSFLLDEIEYAWKRKAL